MTRDRHEPGEHWVSGMPEGTEIIHNPTRQEREQTIGFPDESEFIERHGRHFHLIGGGNRIVIEMAHYVEVRRHGHEELVDERTLYVLPPGTELLEARRIGYKLLQLPHPSEAERGLREGAACDRWVGPRAARASLSRVPIRLVGMARPLARVADLSSTETVRLRRLLLSGAKRLRLPRFRTAPKDLRGSNDS